MARRVRASAHAPKDERTAMWTRRNTPTGVWAEAKKSGGKFRGVHREN